MTQDSTQMEMPLTHIERLDLKAQENAHEAELARIKAEAQVQLAKENRRQVRIGAIKDTFFEYKPLIYIIAIVALLFGVAFGIWSMATSGPPKTIEQIQIEKKQDRWEDCVYEDDNVWYPTAADGNGLCLDKGQPAPK